MEILSQFLLRLAFGLAFGMAITSPQKVFSGFYRNHLYVTLGLATLATLVLARVNSGAAIVAGSAAGAELRWCRGLALRGQTYRNCTDGGGLRLHAARSLARFAEPRFGSFG